MTGDGAVGSGAGDTEHAAASGPRGQNQSRLGDGRAHTQKAGHRRSMQGGQVQNAKVLQRPGRSC